MAAIFFMRSLNANSDGGGCGGAAVKEMSGLVSAAIPGKGNMFRESVCCRMTLVPSLCCRATFEGRSKADVSGEDLKSELALRFLGGGGVLRGAILCGRGCCAGGVTTLARFLVHAARSSSKADGPAHIS